MPPVDILSTFIKADYRLSLLTIILHSLNAGSACHGCRTPTGSARRLLYFFRALDLPCLPEDSSSLPRSSGRIFRIFRGLPEESSGSSVSLPRSSGRVFRVFRGLPEESSGPSGRVFRRLPAVFRGLPEESSGLPCLPLGSRAKTWCSRQINSFQI